MMCTLVQVPGGHTPHTCHTMYIYTSHLRYKENEEARHGGHNDHEYSQGIGRVDEQVLRQHQTQRSSNAHHYHHNVHGNAGKPGVVYEVVLHVAALVGQEEAKHHQETLVDIEGANEIVEVVTVTLFIHLQCVSIIILSVQRITVSAV